MLKHYDYQKLKSLLFIYWLRNKWYNLTTIYSKFYYSLTKNITLYVCFTKALVFCICIYSSFLIVSTVIMELMNFLTIFPKLWFRYLPTENIRKSDMVGSKNTQNRKGRKKLYKSKLIYSRGCYFKAVIILTTLDCSIINKVVINMQTELLTLLKFHE